MEKKKEKVKEKKVDKKNKSPKAKTVKEEIVVVEKDVDEKEVVEEKKDVKKSDIKEKKDNNKLKKVLNVFKKLSLKMKIVSICILVLIIFLLVKALGIFSEQRLIMEATSTLEKIEFINELSSVEYPYSAIATKNNSKGKTLYYVHYKGTVKAGIDFSKITIELDKSKDQFVVTIPEVEVYDYLIDISSLEYLELKSQSDKGSSDDAFKLCKEDLQKRVEDDELFWNTARDNAVDIVEGFLQPWIDSLDDKYEVVFK